MTSEGVGSYWPFATGRRVDQANLLLEQIATTPSVRYILCPNQHIGAWKVGFMPQWIAREYLARRGVAKFKPEQVRFDHRIARRDVAARQISIDLLIAPRVAVDAALAPVQSAGLALDAVDTLAVDGRRNGYNLLPQEARGERSQRDRFLNWIFAAAVIVLAWTAMSTSIRNREKALEDLHAEVDRVKVEARRVGALEKELADAVSGANFLTEMKQTHPVAIDLVRDLTERLPENTALQRLSVNRGEVQIQGVSGEASARRAMPKSVTSARSELRSMRMFSALMSR